ncbi:MAG: DUF692 family protein, partial [Myxococcales bacterium]|nr:DUF692 family protein [Myxococcales bacterium]
MEQAFRPPFPDDWTAALDRAAARGDVVAHAVMGNPYGRRDDPMTHDWLRRTREVLARWPARWLTDHVGCSRADGWNAAPLPLPVSPALRDRVTDHLRWVQDGLGLPVGL